MADEVSYLDLQGFTDLSVMPPEDVDAFETSRPGYIASQCLVWSQRINDQLRKRYAVPFASPYPTIVKLWLVRIVTPEIYDARGWDPSEAQNARITKAAEDALKEVAQAADSNIGLFDLPLRADTTADGITKGGPLGSSEASPFAWTDVQAEAVRNG